MRQVLVTWANAETEWDVVFVNKDFEKDGVGKMIDITAGLESIISVAGAPHSSAAVSTPYSSEERQGLGRDQPSPCSSVSIPQTRPLQPTRRSHPSSLTPNPLPPLKSTPLPTPPSSSDPSTHARHTSLETHLPQLYLTTPEAHPADPPRPVISSADVIRQPKPVHQQKRPPVLDQQHDQQWQSDTRVPYDQSPRSQGKFISGISEHDIFEPHPGQPLLQDVQPPSPYSMPRSLMQQTVKSLQPPSSNPNTDSRPPSASTQYSRPATPELPIPQFRPMPPLPQVNKTPLYQSNSPNPKPTRVSTSSNVRTPPPPMVTSASPRPALHGILKQAPVSVPPRPSTADNADPRGLGVKVAAAPSSHPHPKFKNVFSLWRNTESSNTSHPRIASQPELQPQSLLEPKRPDPRAAMQTLRFSEAVEIIPRPAVDSDPYDDEEGDELPPSPSRGSVIWLENEGGMREGSGDSSENLREMERRHDVAGVPVNPSLSINPSQSSISSASSSPLTEYLTYLEAGFASPLSPDLPSPSRSFPQYLPPTSQDNGLPPLRDQPSPHRGERENSKRTPTEAREIRHKGPSVSRWLDAAYTTSPPESQHLQLAGGRIEKDCDLRYDERLLILPRDQGSQSRSIIFPSNNTKEHEIGP